MPVHRNNSGTAEQVTPRANVDGSATECNVYENQEGSAVLIHDADGEAITIIDDFESYDDTDDLRDLWQTNDTPPDWGIGTSGPGLHAGTQYLECTDPGGGADNLWTEPDDGVLNYYPERGDTIVVHWTITGTLDEKNRAFFWFGHTIEGDDGFGTDGYTVTLDGEQADFELSKRSEGNLTEVDSDPFSYDLNTTYRVVIDFDSEDDGTIQADLYEPDDGYTTSQATVSTTDTDHDHGGIGVQGDFDGGSDAAQHFDHIYAATEGLSNVMITDAASILDTTTSTLTATTITDGALPATPAPATATTLTASTADTGLNIVDDFESYDDTADFRSQWNTNDSPMDWGIGTSGPGLHEGDQYLECADPGGGADNAWTVPGDGVLNYYPQRGDEITLHWTVTGTTAAKNRCWFWFGMDSTDADGDGDGYKIAFDAGEDDFEIHENTDGISTEVDNDPFVFSLDTTYRVVIDFDTADDGDIVADLYEPPDYDTVIASVSTNDTDHSNRGIGFQGDFDGGTDAAQHFDHIYAE